MRARGSLAHRAAAAALATALLILTAAVAAGPASADPPPPPTITSIDPDHAAAGATDATTVTVKGTNFDTSAGGTWVTIDGLPGNNVQVTSSTELTFDAPARTDGPGSVNLYVSTSAGDSSTVQFTYTALTVDSIAPTTGPAAGGTSVTITGTALDDAVVWVDGTSVTPDSISDDGTTLTFTTPSHAPGSAPLELISTHQDVTTYSDPDSTAITFSYVAMSVDSIAPTTGPAAGGTSVTVTGTALNGATVDVDGQTVTPDSISDDGTTLTFTTPSHTAGVAAIALESPPGQDVGVFSDSTAISFTYVAMSVDSVTPSTGPASGGTVVTITGTALTGATVDVDGQTVTPDSISDDGTTLTFTTPKHASGEVALALKALPDQNITSLADPASTAMVFSYTPDGTESTTPADTDSSSDATTTATPDPSGADASASSSSGVDAANAQSNDGSGELATTGSTLRPVGELGMLILIAGALLLAAANRRLWPVRRGMHR